MFLILRFDYASKALAPDDLPASEYEPITGVFRSTPIYAFILATDGI